MVSKVNYEQNETHTHLHTHTPEHTQTKTSWTSYIFFGAEAQCLIKKARDVCIALYIINDQN